MLKPVFACLAIAAWLFAARGAYAHFGMIIPSSSTVTTQEESELALEISFSHPFAGQGMNMRLPEKFGVYVDGAYTDLLGALKPAEIMGAAGFKASHKITRPGVYAFASEPAPYYEPAEDRYIIHYAKTVVGAFGADDGWRKPLGLPVEIVPLLRPFANYAGNVFVGQALVGGKPAADAAVEVEAYNRNGQRKAPNEYFETQTVYCDENGVFAFGIPWPGWWGFAVLAESDAKLPHESGEKSAELGGILWMEFASPWPAPAAPDQKQGASLWRD